MRLFEAFGQDTVIMEQEIDVMTVSAIKAQTGTKEKLDRFLADFGMDESPEIDELVVLLTAIDGNIEYEAGSLRSDLVYRVDTSTWELSLEDGDFGNTMLIGTFYSNEMGDLRDHYISVIGDDTLDAEEGDTEFTFVICPDVGELTADEAEEMFLSFSNYVPYVAFQEQTIGVMTPDQFIQLANGADIIDDREMN